MTYLSFSLAHGKQRAGTSRFYISFSNMDIAGHCKGLLNGRFRSFLQDDVQETNDQPTGFTQIEWRLISHFLELVERGER